MASALRVSVIGAGQARADVVARAWSLELRGWARDDDGLLRVHAEGDEQALAKLRIWLEELGALRAEPAKVEGHEQFAARGVPAGAFVVLADPYLLGLEVDGAMRWWSLPRGPSMDPAAKRLALPTQAEDDGGPAFDRGVYEQGGRMPWPAAIDRGHAVFVLHGERLRGGFALQRTRPPQWLLIKRRDESAESGSDVPPG